MIRYYDKDGRPLPVGEWQRLFEDKAYRRVAHTQLPDGRTLSTIWLGLDHSHGDNGPPLIFETMLFPSQDEQWRWYTLEEAQAGHRLLAQRLSQPSPVNVPAACPTLVGPSSA